MDSLDKFLSYHVDKLTAGRSIPVDLAAASIEMGAYVEEREMIPEAAMQLREGRFHIYIQSNFKDSPGAKLRRRFSWAHEIGHTLFYESKDGRVSVRSDAPRGEALEAACHRAASLILVPSKALRITLQNQTVGGAAQVGSLAQLFEVSVEVMIRRLADLKAFEDRWCPALTRRIDGRLVLEFVPNSIWLKPYLPNVKRGVEFASWFRGSTEHNGVLERQIRGATIEARPVEISSSLVIFELRLR